METLNATRQREQGREQGSWAPHGSTRSTSVARTSLRSDTVWGCCDSESATASDPRRFVTVTCDWRVGRVTGRGALSRSGNATPRRTLFKSVLITDTCDDCAPLDPIKGDDISTSMLRSFISDVYVVVLIFTFFFPFIIFAERDQMCSLLGDWWRPTISTPWRLWSPNKYRTIGSDGYVRERCELRTILNATTALLLYVDDDGHKYYGMPYMLPLLVAKAHPFIKIGWGLYICTVYPWSPTVNSCHVYMYNHPTSYYFISN